MIVSSTLILIRKVRVDKRMLFIAMDCLFFKELNNRQDGYRRGFLCYSCKPKVSLQPIDMDLMEFSKQPDSAQKQGKEVELANRIVSTKSRDVLFPIKNSNSH